MWCENNGEWQRTFLDQRNWFRYKAISLFDSIYKKTEQKFRFRQGKQKSDSYCQHTSGHVRWVKRWFTLTLILKWKRDQTSDE